MNDRIKLLMALQMRFKLNRDIALKIAEQWLQTYPQQSWSDLLTLVNSDKVTYLDDSLVYKNHGNQGSKSSSSEPQRPKSQIQKMYRGRPIN